MPEPPKRKLLAKLIGITPAELQYGKPLDPRRSAALAPILDIDDDEKRLLEAYKLMPDHAKIALRVRAVELLEQFGKPGTKNPFAKAGTQ